MDGYTILENVEDQTLSDSYTNVENIATQTLPKGEDVPPRRHAGRDPVSTKRNVKRKRDPTT